MAITVQCECGRSMTAKDSWAGRAVKCSGCGKAVPVLILDPVPVVVTGDPDDLPPASSRPWWAAPDYKPRPPVSRSLIVLSDHQLLERIASRLGWIIVLIAVPLALSIAGAIALVMLKLFQ